MDYEFPLNERIRTLLRLEDLFHKLFFFTSRDDGLEHHTALVSLFDILEVSGRADLKSDLLQELERQRQILEPLQNNPDVHQDALVGVLDSIDRTSSSLLDISGKMGQQLRENEWLMSIKQRTSLPGGACEFDLPSYHYWLNRSVEVRRRDLQDWSFPFLPIHAGLSIVLRLLRDSGKAAHHVAQQGVFQQMMGGKVAQLLRLSLDDAWQCVPELSANKYQINIRFIAQGSAERAKVLERDIPFSLTSCNL